MQEMTQIASDMSHLDTCQFIKSDVNKMRETLNYDNPIGNHFTNNVKFSTHHFLQEDTVELVSCSSLVNIVYNLGFVCFE